MGVITVSNLGKAYKSYPSRFARLKEWLVPFSKAKHTIKWVLRDISFQINSGEAVGIIGINGAGKSTLLKMLTGTTEPTTGSIRMHGKVAALLELGIGFHPEFTGRQNAYMAGQLLGIGANEMSNLLPEIEEFAEIGDYMDYPVRVYSSGMQVRLAFAVATAQRPDILIIDEALSVGDAYFQHKSFDRIRKFREEGTTLLIVSHDKQAIQSICDRAILLNAGGLAMEGKPENVMDFYNAMLAEREEQSVRQVIDASGSIKTISGSGEATIESVLILNENGASVETIGVGASVDLKIRVKINSDISNLVIGYMLKDRLGQPVYGTNTYHLGEMQHNLLKGEEFEYSFKFNANLGQGSYSISVALHEGSTHLGVNYEWRDRAGIFSVINLSKREFVGVAWLPPKTQILKCDTRGI